MDTLILLAILNVFLVFEDVTAVITASGDTGITNQRNLTLRCNYTVEAGEQISDAGWYILRNRLSSNDKIFTRTSYQQNIFKTSWKNKGVFVGEDDSSLDIQLPAKHVTSSFAGTYRCKVTGTMDVMFMDVNASVVDVTPSHSVKVVIETSRLELNCTNIIYTTPPNPSTNYVWTYAGKHLHDEAVLIRENIKRNKKGNYTCTAGNNQASAVASVDVDVQYGPVIYDLPSNIRLLETSTLMIDCSSYTKPGNPKTTNYTWTFGSSTISTSARLEIRSFSRIHAGNYTCTASNTMTPSNGPQQGTSVQKVKVDIKSPSTNTGSNVFAPVAGGMGGVLFVITIVVILHKRGVFTSAEKDNQDDNTTGPGLEDQPETNTGDIYAIPQKKKNNNKGDADQKDMLGQSGNAECALGDAGDNSENQGRSVVKCGRDEDGLMYTGVCFGSQESTQPTRMITEPTDYALIAHVDRKPQ